MTSLCSYPGKVDNLKKLIFWTLDIVFPHSTRAGGKRYVTETQGVSEYHRYQVYPSRSGFDQRSQPRICGTSCSNRKKKAPQMLFHPALALPSVSKTCAQVWGARSWASWAWPKATTIRTTMGPPSGTRPSNGRTGVPRVPRVRSSRRQRSCGGSFWVTHASLAIGGLSAPPIWDLWEFVFSVFWGRQRGWLVDEGFESEHV